MLTVSLQFPFNNDCLNNSNLAKNLNMAVARENCRHVKKTLPPSMSGFPRDAEIRYYVKATVGRPQFYKENYRAVCVSAEWMAQPLSHFLIGSAKAGELRFIDVVCFRLICSWPSLLVSNSFRLSPQGRKILETRLLRGVNNSFPKPRSYQRERASFGRLELQLF